MWELDAIHHDLICMLNEYPTVSLVYVNRSTYSSADRGSEGHKAEFSRAGLAI